MKTETKLFTISPGKARTVYFREMNTIRAITAFYTSCLEVVCLRVLKPPIDSYFLLKKYYFGNSYPLESFSTIDSGRKNELREQIL